MPVMKPASSGWSLTPTSTGEESGSPGWAGAASAGQTVHGQAAALAGAVVSSAAPPGAGDATATAITGSAAASAARQLRRTPTMPPGRASRPPRDPRLAEAYLDVGGDAGPLWKHPE